MASILPPISLGTFQFDTTAAGGAVPLTPGPGPWTVYVVTADSWDDTIAIEISHDGASWFVHTTGIAADGYYTITDVAQYVRANPVGGGSVGSVTLSVLGLSGS